MENKIKNTIFGYSNTGGKHWFNSSAYHDREIEEIRDPEGGSEISHPTAIPSPFARIDLTKTAFRNINKTPKLKAHKLNGAVLASKMDEKLVSDCFDVGELLFNFNTVRENIRIIVWDREHELENLKLSSDKHRRLAETLELYLDQDKEAYNFDLLTKLYLIEYDRKIIGCTSPITLFFASANDLRRAQIQLMGNDVLFDNNYVPLYDRDPEFQKYFYLLFKAHPILSERMTDFTDYLRKNKEILDEINKPLSREIEALDAADYKNLFVDLNAGTANSEIEVLGVGLRKRKSEDIIDYIASNSDFRIASEKVANGSRPLVLQKDFAKSWRYAKDNWLPLRNFPFTRESPEQRNLPGINIPYPYLTDIDFLEPYLIRLVYPINKEKFFDGNLNTNETKDNSKGYLLPLKKAFFDYFNAEDLISGGVGKPSIKIIPGVGDSVQVILKIPVARTDEYITFERLYFDHGTKQISKPDEENNKGAIVEHQVGLTLFPFIKTNDPGIKAFYRVQVVDRDFFGLLKDNDYRLEFYSNVSPDPIKISGDEPRIRSIKGVNSSDATSKYYVLDSEFDFIQIKSNVASGIVLPIWQPFYQGQKEFRFAVDFGTTNTHIEYDEDGTIKPFDIVKHNEIQIATLFHPEKTSENLALLAISELIDHEFVPSQISKELTNSKSIYKFPQRTVISESQSLDVQTQPLTLADFNIPFIYEKRKVKEGSSVQSNLKWAATGNGNEERIKAFLEEIIMLLRNKVLLNNGNLSKTKLFWFYPSSMTKGRVATLRSEWNQLFNDYFNPTGQTIGITESMAPFFYFKNEDNDSSFKPVVSIDIGGGTTDIVVFKEDKPILITSFKFAANAIFGDGFSEYSTKSNGFVNKYLTHFESLLKKNSLNELSDVLSSMKDKSRNEDINAFFFSIEDNPTILTKQQFSYNTILSKDEDLKIIFVYFYTAVVYHIASVMRSNNVELPKKLNFSGTGSKMLNIITSDLQTLADLSKKIFEEVYAQQFKEDLKIKTVNTPKEVTCKGGLMVSNTEELEKIKVGEIRAILTCIENNKETSDGSANKDAPTETAGLRYIDLTDPVKAQITSYVEEFNKFFIKLSSEFRFTENFNITEKSLRTFRNEFNKDIRDYLEAGLAYTKRLDDVKDDNNEIGETLFFYPIIGTISKMGRTLAEPIK